ncbi:hypothetical protein QWT69_14285 [Sporosarcina oncorhynchi]|uniref:Uncharacterized protein n=1 Tax=Sporosarcina oncorhynchi TaxID=3056444 RepID=A0ABZ0L5U4_9BACL|nr:hypothetical protein [Sporosarcina sp. T2O-4]WOV87027.1 hypothetical protein QWT69_14285 [Sporosarcina sp. T2O-4]
MEETEGHDIYEEPYRGKEKTGRGKELSYFEQLLEKNRKQMNHPPSERKSARLSIKKNPFCGVTSQNGFFL